MVRESVLICLQITGNAICASRLPLTGTNLVNNRERMTAERTTPQSVASSLSESVKLLANIFVTVCANCVLNIRMDVKKKELYITKEVLVKFQSFL